MECQKIIIDCDAGSDDALALAMLISAHKLKKVEILGVTCVAGNTCVDNVVINVFKTLDVCKALEIPVFKGAASALLTTDNYEKCKNLGYHGSDGLGDVFKDKPDDSKLNKEHAVFALQRLTNENYGQVTVVCLAPLTNIALTIKMYPDFVNSVHRFLVMGGNLSAMGNVTPQAEFNFYADPESVHIVMSTATKKLWLLPWEACTRSRITYEWRDTVFGKVNTPLADFFNMIDNAIYTNEEKAKLPYYTPCDAFLAAFLLRTDVATKIQMHHVDIELNGVRTRGQVVIDHLLTNEPNAYVIEDVNSDILKRLLMFTVDPTPPNSNIIY